MTKKPEDEPRTPPAPPTHGTVYAAEGDTGGPDHGSPANYPQAGQTRGPRHDNAPSDPTATGTDADPDMPANPEEEESRADQNSRLRSQRRDGGE